MSYCDCGIRATARCVDCRRELCSRHMVAPSIREATDRAAALERAWREAYQSDGAVRCAACRLLAADAAVAALDVPASRDLPSHWWDRANAERDPFRSPSELSEYCDEAKVRVDAVPIADIVIEWQKRGSDVPAQGIGWYRPRFGGGTKHHDRGHAFKAQKATHSVGSPRADADGPYERKLVAVLTDGRLVEPINLANGRGTTLAPLAEEAIDKLVLVRLMGQAVARARAS